MSSGTWRTVSKVSNRIGFWWRTQLICIPIYTICPMIALFLPGLRLYIFEKRLLNSKGDMFITNDSDISPRIPKVSSMQRDICRHVGDHYQMVQKFNIRDSISRMHLNTSYFSVPPMIWIQNQLVGAHEGQQMTLECNSEAYPKSINYWTRDKGDIIAQGNYLHI